MKIDEDQSEMMNNDRVENQRIVLNTHECSKQRLQIVNFSLSLEKRKSLIPNFEGSC